MCWGWECERCLVACDGRRCLWDRQKYTHVSDLYMLSRVQMMAKIVARKIVRKSELRAHHELFPPPLFLPPRFTFFFFFLLSFLSSSFFL